jgi:chromosome segregation ATPase
MDNRILNLILDKLENIEKEQQEMRNELSELRSDQQSIKSELSELRNDQQSIKSELSELKNDQQSIKSELSELRSDQQSIRNELGEMKREICHRLDRLEQGQEAIKEFMFNAEKAFQRCEKDHKFIENLKKAIGE